MQTVTFENNKQVLEYAASNADQILVLFSTYVEIEMIDAKLPENVIVASSFAQTYAGARKERGFTGFEKSLRQGQRQSECFHVFDR